MKTWLNIKLRYFIFRVTYYTQNVTIPDYGDPDVLPEIIYHLIEAVLRAVDRTSGLACHLAVDEDYVELSMGDFEFSHLYDEEPGSSSDAKLCELAFNALCEAMLANGICQEYF